MKTIKFRVWDKGLKKMYYQEGEWFISDEYNNEKHCYEGYLTFPIPVYENPEGYQKDMEVSQFTGLLDKNGKEIYEGDIVKHTRGYPSEGQYESSKTHVVVWDSIEDFDMGLSEHVPDAEGLPYDTSLIRVIGNIYENPDLLK